MIHPLLIIIIVLFRIAEPEPDQILTEDYHFLVTDGIIKKLRQRNDTLFEIQCYPDWSCIEKPTHQYRIIRSETVAPITVLYLERLESIRFSTDPYPANRFSLLAINKSDSNKIGYLDFKRGLTKVDIDTMRLDPLSLKDKFFFSWYGDRYLKVLSVNRKMKTKEDAQSILDLVKSGRFQKLIEQYQKTATSDLYGSGLTAELFTRACIEKKIDPVGAGILFNKLLVEE